MPLQITITEAGLAEIVNAENTGTAPVVIAEVGIGTGQYTPTPSQTALVAEIKRLDTIAGVLVSDDTIHITIRDDSADAYDASEFGLYTASGTLFAVYSQTSGPFFEKTPQAILLLSTDIVLTTLDTASLTFGDVSFVNPPASESTLGVVRLATDAEVQAGSNTLKSITPAGLSARTATESRTGVVELATTAEAQAGTDTERAITPAVMRADSATANTANRVVRRGSAGEIAVGDLDAADINYTGGLTGGTGPINIGSGQLVKDVDGNIGIGTSLGPWNGYTALQVKAASMASSGTEHFSAANAYYDSAWKYYFSGVGATYCEQYNGEWKWYTAPAGTAFSPASFTQRMALSLAGNLGLGTPPSPWNGYTALQVKAASIASSGSENISAANAYFNSGWKYYSSGVGATYCEQYNGEWKWYTAPAGTAFSPASFTQRMALSLAGNLLIATATDDGVHKLQVNGAVSASSYAGAGTGLTGTAASLNAGTATALQTARNINGVAFNGTANITLPTVNDTGNQSVSGIKTFSDSPLVPTTTQFAEDGKAASTEFVQRALGNASGFRGIVANASLTAADAGKIIYASSTTGSISISLPSASSMKAGVRFEIYNTGVDDVIVTRVGGDTIVVSNTTNTVTAVTLKAGDSIELICLGAGSLWYHAGGTAQLKNASGQFGASLASSGYQLLPSGLIMQWGKANVSSSGLSILFPISFPSVALGIHLVMESDSAPVGEFNPQYSSLTLSGAVINNGRGVTTPTFWTAIGY